MTILVGDNGTGTSTIVEALAVAAGFNAEGGSRNLRFETYASIASSRRSAAGCDPCVRVTGCGLFDTQKGEDGLFDTQKCGLELQVRNSSPSKLPELRH